MDFKSWKVILIGIVLVQPVLWVASFFYPQITWGIRIDIGLILASLYLAALWLFGRKAPPL